MYKTALERKNARKQSQLVYKQKYPDRIKASSRKYQLKSANKLKDYYLNKYKLKAFKNKLKRNYGLLFSEYMEMRDFQKGLCAICYKPETKQGVMWLSVDHNHRTGIIRALLCSGCNIGLGTFKENSIALKNAAIYIELLGGI